MVRRVRVSVPASTANLGPGFDAVGLALDLFNVVEVEVGGDDLRVEIVGEASDLAREDNLVLRAMEHGFAAAGSALPPLRVRLTNRIPVGCGLGSSAAAIVAGLMAANALLGDPWSPDRLLALATELEGHPDNVAPALWGGLVVSCCTGDGVRWVRLEAPSELQAVLVIPELRVPTREARRVLPGAVPFQDAVFNVGRVALLVAALSCRQYHVLREAMRDRLHQPYRAPLVPGFEEALVAAERAGALGVALSGAGPGLLAFTVGDGRPVAEAVQAALARHGVLSTWTVARPTDWGALATVCRR